MFSEDKSTLPGSNPGPPLTGLLVTSSIMGRAYPCQHVTQWAHLTNTTLSKTRHNRHQREPHSTPWVTPSLHPPERLPTVLNPWAAAPVKRSTARVFQHGAYRENSTGPLSLHRRAPFVDVTVDNNHCPRLRFVTHKGESPSGVWRPRHIWAKSQLEATYLYPTAEMLLRRPAIRVIYNGRDPLTR